MTPIMWTYQITTGRMTRDSVPPLCFTGYSGAGHTLAEGRNNPDMQAVVSKGPVPIGRYEIGAPYDSAHTGPFTLALDAIDGTDTHGRDLFRIHGNNSVNDASHGCIILPPDARRAIVSSRDTTLQVIV